MKITRLNIREPPTILQRWWSLTIPPSANERRSKDSIVLVHIVVRHRRWYNQLGTSPFRIFSRH